LSLFDWGDDRWSIVRIRRMSQDSHFELGEVIDEYRISRIVVGFAWMATIIFGLIWIALMAMAVGMTLQGDADFGGILLGGLPITLLFCASVYATFRLQRTLVRMHDEGFVYREGKRYYEVPYSQISSADVITERRWRYVNGRRVMVDIHWLRVRLNDEARTEIRVEPMLLRDQRRLGRWAGLMCRPRVRNDEG
jgi:hypothetical protein